MLVYLAMATELPYWAINAIDNIRIDFVWRGRKEAKGDHCLISLAQSVLFMGVWRTRNI